MPSLQVMNDFEPAYIVAANPCAEEIIERALECKLDRLKRTRAWIRREDKQATESWRPKKKRRVKAEQWLRAVDSQLRLASQHTVSLDALVQPADVTLRSSAFDWPSASVNSDQGPDGVCAVGWCQRFANCNLDATWDLSHIVANSWKGGMAQSGLMPFHRLMTVGWNARHGPWLEAVRWGQAMETMQHHVSLMQCAECPLFVQLLPKILADSGEAHRIHERDIAEVVWNDLQEGLPWRRRGTHVSDTRFLASLRESRSEDKVFHARQYGYVLASLEFDLLKGAKFTIFFRLRSKSNTAAPGSEEEKGLRSELKASETALRSVCANLLVLATMLYSSDRNQFLERIIVFVSSPLEAWHSHQNKTLRSASATTAWALEQHDGGLLRTACDIAATVQHVHELPKLGFTVLTHQAELHEWVNAHDNNASLSIEDSENELADCMGKLLLAIIGNWLHRLVWFFRGWPMSSVRMLQAGMSRPTMQLLRRDRDNFQLLSESLDAHHATLVRRSCFQCVPVQQVVSWLDEEGGYTARVEEALARKHKRIFCTQVVEDGFHEARNTEDRHLNKVALPRSCYEALKDSKILSQRHKYQEPDFSSRPLRRNGRVPYEAFCSKVDTLAEEKGIRVDRKLSFSSIMGYGQPSWYSPGATNLNVPFCDLEMCDQLERAGSLHMSKHAWLSCFLDGDNLLIRQVRPAVGPWFFALGGMDDTASIVWPAHSVPVAPASPFWAFIPSTTCDKVAFVTVVDLADWEALVYEWKAPVWCQHQMPRSFSEEPPAVRAICDNKPQALLEVAAEACFWKFGLTRCISIANHLKIKVPAGGSLCEVLLVLVMSILHLDEVAGLELLAKRLYKMDARSQLCYSELLECDEALHFMTRDDEKAMREDRDQMCKQGEECTTFKEVWVQKMTVAKGYKGKLSATAKKKILKGIKVGLTRVPAGDFSEDQARQMLPPAASIWQEVRDDQWRGRVFGGNRVSRACLCYGGSRGAAIEVLRIVWTQWLEQNLLSPEDCLVTDLFTVDGHSGGAASSSG